MNYWEIIADNLRKAGWSWGCISAIDSNGRTIWIADAHHGDGKRFAVRADEKLTAFGGTQIVSSNLPVRPLRSCSCSSASILEVATADVVSN